MHDKSKNSIIFSFFFYMKLPSRLIEFIFALAFLRQLDMFSLYKSFLSISTPTNFTWPADSICSEPILSAQYFVYPF